MQRERETINYSYPGDYVPLLTQEQIDEQLSRFQEGEIQLPPVNIEELDDEFRMEIAIPGLKREDFLIHIDAHVLFIRVLNKTSMGQAGPKFKLHEFNYDCFEKRVDLPSNADAEFMSAEYKAGLLQVIIPKSARPVDNPHVQVVVY